MNKFNIGDKVKVINYVLLYWVSNNSGFGKNILKNRKSIIKNEFFTAIDLFPEIIGVEGLITDIHKSSKQSYHISSIGIWFNENQLEKIN